MLKIDGDKTIHHLYSSPRVTCRSVPEGRRNTDELGAARVVPELLLRRAEKALKTHKRLHAPAAKPEERADFHPRIPNFGLQRFVLPHVP